MSGKAILYSACGQFKVTAEIVEKFARLVGDHNPVHLSEQAASKTRFGRRIAHGMVAVSYAHSLLPTNYSYSSLNIKFKRPVYLDDIVRPNQLQIHINKIVTNRDKADTRTQELVTEATGIWTLTNNPTTSHTKSDMV